VQRERLLHGTAAAVHAKGSVEVTVAEIVVAAGLSREVFYAHFHDKREALLAAQQLIFEQMMAACAGAFFTPNTPWRERVWQTGRAFTGFIVAQPDLARLGFVETYALGDAEAQPRTDEFLLAFTVFLREADRQRAAAGEVPEVFHEAIAGAVMEIAASHIRRGHAAELPGLLGVIVYTILTPFLGRDAADEFVRRKLQELGVSDAHADGDHVAA